MKKIAESLSQLVIEACKHPPGSKERQKNLTKIIRLVNSQLWQENTPYYEDALQETWIYFCRNICEGKANITYDPNKATVVTWLNNYLKWRLKDGFIRVQKNKQRTISTRIDATNKIIDPIDNLPARPDIPPLLEDIKQWVLSDPQNKLSKIYLDNHPQITAQTLILRRLPPESPWNKLAEEYGVSVGTLSSFYQRKCKPLLREYSQNQGYI
ncbi:MAG: sigma-70 family RNA polymerase sigma factor [Cyanobacteria bacterium P01_F01_bin.143]